MNELTEVLSSALKGKEQTGSDYTAKVTRVEGQTAYVQITGSDIADTPVAMTIAAEPGDTVRVRVANGKAWITGNDTRPPGNNDALVLTMDGLSSEKMDSDMENRAESIVIRDGTIEFKAGTLVITSKNFSLDRKGNAKFSGNLDAAGGTFAGNLQAAGGTFAGNLSAAGGTFSGNLSAAGGTFSGELKVKRTYNVNVETVAIGDPTQYYPLVITREQTQPDDGLYANAFAVITQFSNQWCMMSFTGISQSSDRQLKEDIEEIDPEIAKQLNPVRFRFKGDEKIRYGFIAQDIEKIMPAAVNEGKNGLLSLNYTELIAPLAALVLDQEKRIASLETRLKELEDKLT